MIKLVDINEKNWCDIRRLSFSNEQQKFLDSPTGVLARGYIYRNCNAKVFGISNDNEIIGIALVKDLDEEPACYDLQQFMIDKRFQNKGFGTEALKLIISKLQDEGKYNCVEVCINKSNTAALRLFEKIGFKDTGYVDSNTPDCLNLMYYFDENRCMECYTDKLISDFSDPAFQNAFKQYFMEMNFNDVEDWDDLFKQMNDGNLAFVRYDENKEVIGFIQFTSLEFTRWFFEETYGFIREFWVAKKYRDKRHGSELLRLAEQYMLEKGVFSSILTTDTAEKFYLKNGYEKVPGCKSKNNDDVFVKRLK